MIRAGHQVLLGYCSQGGCAGLGVVVEYINCWPIHGNLLKLTVEHIPNFVVNL